MLLKLRIKHQFLYQKNVKPMNSSKLFTIRHDKVNLTLLITSV